MTLSGYGIDALKVLAAAGPVAGLVAVAHVRSSRRRRQQLKAEAALRTSRSVFVDVPGAKASASVRFDLTPQLLGWLAAAQSGSLHGMETPDAVMLAFDVDATWKGIGSPGLEADSAFPSQLIATRELFIVRSMDPWCDSAEISLRSMLDAHRTLPEGEPLYCSVEGSIRLTPTRRMRAPSMPVPRQFYWVRAEAQAAEARRRPS
ncbi:hypothetical protein QTH97_10895 [Variovorax sp. J22R24]|uniref:hypothetical protein n=1 Tax=Variovorax gracilis TaxID=3053502 RepID=UPI0025791436|nr:hypothetical protein [Variovorax sp. J22R24]MDM0105442.1 hypothetical protein [Variovorax sp. J22R24]